MDFVDLLKTVKAQRQHLSELQGLHPEIAEAIAKYFCCCFKPTHVPKVGVYTWPPPHKTTKSENLEQRLRALVGHETHVRALTRLLTHSAAPNFHQDVQDVISYVKTFLGGDELKAQVLLKLRQRRIQ